MEEKIYYQDQGVIVTNSRFVTGGTTYAMRNISSVKMGVIEPNHSTPYCIIAVCGLLVLFAGITFKIIGAVVIGICIWYIRQNKPKYTVRINSNSGEVNSLISSDMRYIGDIVAGINSAIIGH